MANDYLNKADADVSLSDQNNIEWLDKAVSSFSESAEKIWDAAKQKIQELKAAYQAGTILPEEAHKALNEIKETADKAIKQVVPKSVVPKSVGDVPTGSSNIPEKMHIDLGAEEHVLDEIKPRIEFKAPIHGDYLSYGGIGVVKPDGRVHKGVDLRSPLGGGTEVYPIADGTVKNVGTNPLGGLTITIVHNDGVHKSYYAHLLSARVSPGDKVTTDSVIGQIGASGNAGGVAPHLHLQVWKNNEIIDPAKLFHVPAYTPFNPLKEKIWNSPDGKSPTKKNNDGEQIDSIV